VESGWSIGRNVQLDVRWAGPNAAKIRQQAEELVAIAPDVIFATGGTPVAALQQINRSLPIVFVQVPDPVGAGFVDSLAQPGGRVTALPSTNMGLARNCWNY